MANPSDFPQRTNIFVGPPGMKDCSNLPAHVGHFKDGQPCVIARWELEAEEYAAVLETGAVWIVLWGHQVIPHAIAGCDPFEKPETPRKFTTLSDDALDALERSEWYDDCLVLPACTTDPIRDELFEVFARCGGENRSARGWAFPSNAKAHRRALLEADCYARCVARHRVAFAAVAAARKLEENKG